MTYFFLLPGIWDWVIAPTQKEISWEKEAPLNSFMKLDCSGAEQTTAVSGTPLWEEQMLLC